VDVGAAVRVERDQLPVELETSGQVGRELGRSSVMSQPRRLRARNGGVRADETPIAVQLCSNTQPEPVGIASERASIGSGSRRATKRAYPETVRAVSPARTAGPR